MYFSEWTFLDLFFAAIILISTGVAILKGLAREVISLIALIGGFVLAVLYYKIPAAWLVEHTRKDTLADLLGFLIIFIGCILIGIVAAYIVNRLVKAASLKWIDRILGGIFGFLRGWAIASIIVVALIAFPVREDIMARSILAPFLLSGARTAVLLVPQDLKDSFNEHYREVLQRWNESRSDI
jgi:membrane protein required for colicin V production